MSARTCEASVSAASTYAASWRPRTGVVSVRKSRPTILLCRRDRWFFYWRFGERRRGEWILARFQGGDVGKYCRRVIRRERTDCLKLGDGVSVVLLRCVGDREEEVRVRVLRIHLSRALKSRNSAVTIPRSEPKDADLEENGRVGRREVCCRFRGLERFLGLALLHFKLREEEDGLRVIVLERDGLREVGFCAAAAFLFVISSCASTYGMIGFVGFNVSACSYAVFALSYAPWMPSGTTAVHTPERGPVLVVIRPSCVEVSASETAVERVDWNCVLA
jgi:hypothetical protein